VRMGSRIRICMMHYFVHSASCVCACVWESVCVCFYVCICLLEEGGMYVLCDFLNSSISECTVTVL